MNHPAYIIIRITTGVVLLKCFELGFSALDLGVAAALDVGIRCAASTSVFFRGKAANVT